MNLHFNARELSSPIKEEKIHKKDLVTQYETIVLKQFYERLARKHSKKNR
jgi:hypothetical protein